VLDIGAGNCWLAARLADLGYHVAALDLNLDASDGLGALRMNTSRQQTAISPVRADFHALPFAEGAFDFAIFNASLHYSANPQGAIEETLRVLKHEGVLYIMDSPLYRDHRSGDMMIAARRSRFRNQYDLEIPDEFAGSFLTAEMLKRLEREYCLEMIVPDYGLRWASRPIFARLLGKREPASFGIIALSRSFKR
jgi:SAM-dependent methyltransferase